MSDYLSRSEIDRVLDSVSDVSCEEWVQENIDEHGSETENNVFDIEDICADNNEYFGVDDLFSDSENEDPPIPEHRKVKYIAKCGNESREYLVHTPRSKRRNIANIFRENPGLKLSGRVNNIIEAFKLFFVQDALSMIILHTNQEAMSKGIEPTNENEILAFMGILFIMGSNNDNKLDIHDLWSKEFGKSAYVATMSRNRFRELLTVIRFDDKQTRQARRATDKFAPFREIFNIINNTFPCHFTPSMNTVIDEMLSLFRGRCPFKVFMKEKPGKYGMLIRILADCDHHFVINMEVYSGPQPGVPNGTIPVVKRLVTPINNSARNVTTDRFYTSVPLAEDLYTNHNLTLVGTMQTNRRFIPKELKNVNRPLHSSMFAFTDPDSNHPPITLQSYIAREKPKRNLIFLSTQHLDGMAQMDNDKCKSDINLFYNATKGGVDTIDQMARRFSTKRGTRRWPLSMFYTLLDIVGINAYSIFIQNHPNWNDKKTNRRRLFLQELGLQLIKPHIEERAKNINGLQNHVLMAIENVLGRRMEKPRTKTSTDNSKGRCHVCCSQTKTKKEKTNKLAKTTIVCNNCGNYVCGKHSVKTNVCLECNAEDSE